MALNVEFSERDLARGRLLPPAWYHMKIDSVSAKPSKDAKSTNFVVEGTVIRNADDGSTEAKVGDEIVQTAGAIVTWNFNSKAPGFMQGFFKAFMDPSEKITPGERYDLESTVGRELEVYVENGEWQGNIVNRVQHKYRALRS